MYTNEDGTIVERFPDHYIATMPIAIETMPMCHYHPRETFLQASGIGCTFSCGGCISETVAHHAEAVSGALKHIPPEVLVRRAREEMPRDSFLPQRPDRHASDISPGGPGGA